MAFDFQPRLTGELLDLRPTTAEDWDGLYAIGSDPDVWALHPISDRWREDVFRAYFQDGLASGGALTAIDRGTGAVAGWSRYSLEFVEPGEIEIGWTFLARPYWGGRHNADMKRVMLAHAFASFERVILRIGEGNLRSRRAAEKIGARLTDRRDATHLFYAIERSEFGS